MEPSSLRLADSMFRPNPNPAIATLILPFRAVATGLLESTMELPVRAAPASQLSSSAGQNSALLQAYPAFHRPPPFQAGHEISGT